jgi:hypothetical protein
VCAAKAAVISRIYHQLYDAAGSGVVQDIFVLLSKWASSGEFRLIGDDRYFFNGSDLASKICPNYQLPVLLLRLSCIAEYSLFVI